MTFDNVLMNVGCDAGYHCGQQAPSKQAGTVWDFGNNSSEYDGGTAALDPLGQLQDLREYDVPYVVRVCTDLNIRAGTWYTVELQDATAHATAAATDLDTLAKGEQIEHDGGVRLVDPDHEQKANPTFLAFDIECTKPPLKFPSAEVDEIFMISYMVTTATGSQGYLICSRSVVSQDIDDFEYTPQPKYPGPFEIFNEVDEKALLERFFIEYKPTTTNW
jgi:DNA polymerase epsilon subunit 1